MARIAGVDLPREKRVQIALTYIYGIGRPTSDQILTGDGVRIQLPGAEPSAPVSQAQASALVGQYLAGAEEVVTKVRAARVVSADRGYVELVREYRVAGTDETRRQSVLLGYRLADDGWILTELRITRD